MEKGRPEALEGDFDAFARKASSAASDDDLADGHWITFRTRETPAGHVMRRYPDRRLEMVRIELSPASIAPDE